MSSAGESSEGKKSIFGSRKSRENRERKGRKETQRMKFAMCKGQSKTHISLKWHYFNLNPFSFCSNSAVPWQGQGGKDQSEPLVSCSRCYVQSGYLPTATLVSLPDRWRHVTFNWQLGLSVFSLSPLTNLLLQIDKPCWNQLLQAFVRAIFIPSTHTGWLFGEILWCCREGFCPLHWTALT